MALHRTTKHQVIKSYSISEILPLIKLEGSIDLEGYKVNVDSLRLRMFAEKGCNCIKCGAEGQFFLLEFKDLKAESPHLNLYALNSQKETILMTKDHRIPSSKGGKNNLNNLFPMCYTCNHAKGDSLEENSATN